MKAYHIIQLLLLLCAVSLNVEAQEIDHDKITFTVTLSGHTRILPDRGLPAF